MAGACTWRSRGRVRAPEWDPSSPTEPALALPLQEAHIAIECRALVIPELIADRVLAQRGLHGEAAGGRDEAQRVEVGRKDQRFRILPGWRVHGVRNPELGRRLAIRTEFDAAVLGHEAERAGQPPGWRRPGIPRRAGGRDEHVIYPPPPHVPRRPHR